MHIRHRPGILFFVVGVSFLATASLLRQTILPPIPYEYPLLTGISLVASLVVTHLLFVPPPRRQLEASR